MNEKFEKLGFYPADILLPKGQDMTKWAVVACDQFTSEPEYWEAVERQVGDAPSTLRLILPEANLKAPNVDELIGEINASMEKYLAGGVFETLTDSLLYIERQQSDGTIRHGLIGMVDLDDYDFTPGSGALIRATEATVTERIPPRMQIREGAALELPHVLLLCDDPEDLLIGLLGRQKAAFPKLYGFELMQGGGQVRGWLLEGVVLRRLRERLDAYCAGRKLCYAVGDGNHSLATAKACWEQIKKEHAGEDLSGHPARYASVELENLHGPGQRWEAIHRLVTGCDAEKLFSAAAAALDDGAGAELRCVTGSGERVLHLSGSLPVARLQAFLDAYLSENAGSLDYIHGEDALRALAAREGSLGFLLPAMDKGVLFPAIEAGELLPRKTFSMGSAREKRYYLEARIIQ